MNGDQNSSKLKALSGAFVLILVAYYAILLFHWNELDRLKLTILGLLPSTMKLGVAAIAALLSLIPILLKFIFGSNLYSNRRSVREVVDSIVRISFYVIIIIGLSFVLIFLGKLLISFFSNSYWDSAHFFWVALFIFLILGFAGLLLYKYGLISWQLLDDLKAIPIVSPIFCFGGPAFWSNNLKYASIDPKLITVYNSLSIVAGVIFIVYLALYAIFNQRYKKDDSDLAQENLLLDSSGKQISQNINQNSRKPIYYCVGIFSLGFSLFLFMIVDMLSFLLIK